MYRDKLMPGAILLLAVALLFNGVALLSRPDPQARGIAPAPLAAADQTGPRIDPPIYYLSRNTYFITAGSDGREVHLWFYNHSPVMRQNSIEHVLSERTR